MTLPGQLLRPLLFSRPRSAEALIPQDSLSELVGFPIDQLKEELDLEADEISMENLRKSVLKFLDLTMEEFKKTE